MASKKIHRKRRFQADVSPPLFFGEYEVHPQ